VLNSKKEKIRELTEKLKKGHVLETSKQSTSTTTATLKTNKSLKMVKERPQNVID
jgi:hypothetical protein